MDDAKRLRAALSRERSEGKGTSGRAFSAGLRQSLANLLSRERTRGTKVRDLGRSLGLSGPTVYAWSSTGKQSESGASLAEVPRLAGKFQQLAVVPARGGQGGEKQGNSGSGGRSQVEGTLGIVVTGPGGLSVVGMSVSDVAELFRRLGC